MSRRPPNPAAERTAQNTQTIKSLLKLEVNKSCADCKRNKRMPHVPNVHGLKYLEQLLTQLARRSKMGKLESGDLHLHSLLWDSPWDGNAHQQS
jgi:hypothetical protein